ncbi:MAG: stage III sporulation protein AB [Clostridia bacterium]|nr:stage III sporulation protein AB [Clostridia bacterium]
MHWMMALLASLGCCGLGFAVSGAAARRLRTLRAGAQAVQSIRLGVCVGGQVLAHVLQELPAGESAEGRAWAAFYGGMGKKLAEEPGVSLPDTWREAFEHTAHTHPALHSLQEDDLRLLEPLREGLGKTPRDEQQALLDEVYKQLQAQHESLRPKLADTQKVAQALGMLGGLALFLLLI